MNGLQAEVVARNLLRAQGWDASLVYDRWGRQSRGPFDLVCHRGTRNRLIQVKLRRDRVVAEQEARSLARWYARTFPSSDPHTTVEVWVFFRNSQGGHGLIVREAKTGGLTNRRV